MSNLSRVSHGDLRGYFMRKTEADFSINITLLQPRQSGISRESSQVVDISLELGFPA
jgi:hypothetical protein